MQHLRQLRDDLNKLCEGLDDKYSINCGGCCYVAYLIAEQLEKLGLKYKLVVYSWDKKNIELINTEVHSQKLLGNDNSVAGEYVSYHYAIHIVRIGTINPADDEDAYSYYLRGITASNIKWLYKTGCWNHCYSTANNKTIRNIIKSFFNDRQKSKETCKGSEVRSRHRVD